MVGEEGSMVGEEGPIGKGSTNGGGKGSSGGGEGPFGADASMPSGFAGESLLFAAISSDTEGFNFSATTPLRTTIIITNAPAAIQRISDLRTDPVGKSSGTGWVDTRNSGATPLGIGNIGPPSGASGGFGIDMIPPAPAVISAAISSASDAESNGRATNNLPGSGSAPADPLPSPPKGSPISNPSGAGLSCVVAAGEDAFMCAKSNPASCTVLSPPVSPGAGPGGVVMSGVAADAAGVAPAGASAVVSAGTEPGGAASVGVAAGAAGVAPAGASAVVSAGTEPGGAASVGVSAGAAGVAPAGTSATVSAGTEPGGAASVGVAPAGTSATVSAGAEPGGIANAGVDASVGGVATSGTVLGGVAGAAAKVGGTAMLGFGPAGAGEDALAGSCSGVLSTGVDPGGIATVGAAAMAGFGPARLVGDSATTLSRWVSGVSGTTAGGPPVSASYTFLRSGSSRQLFTSSISSSNNPQSRTFSPGRTSRTLANWLSAACEITPRSLSNRLRPSSA